jgi:transposase
MRTRFSVAAHLSAEELAARYRAANDPVLRSRCQMIRLLVAGRPLAEVAEVTGYSTRWVREVVRRYNEAGPEGRGDRRHANRGAEPLLDAAGRAALEAVLDEPPPEGGLWTGREVAGWIAGRSGRAPERVAPQRGWDYLRRLRYSRQVPRPRHAAAADAAAQAAFHKA